jgi:hypothetical protein
VASDFLGEVFACIDTPDVEEYTILSERSLQFVCEMFSKPAGVGTPVVDENDSIVRLFHFRHLQI